MRKLMESGREGQAEVPVDNLESASLPAAETKQSGRGSCTSAGAAGSPSSGGEAHRGTLSAVPGEEIDSCSEGPGVPRDDANRGKEGLALGFAQG